MHLVSEPRMVPPNSVQQVWQAFPQQPSFNRYPPCYFPTQEYLEYPDSPNSIGSYDLPSPPRSPSPPPKTSLPAHIGTIYEAYLAPLLPSIVLDEAKEEEEEESSLQSEFSLLVSRKDPEKLEKFLKLHIKELNINQMSKEGETALHRLCQEYSTSGVIVSMVKVLLKYGADPRMPTLQGWSPLHIVSNTGNSEVMMCLMRALRS